MFKTDPGKIRVRLYGGPRHGEEHEVRAFGPLRYLINSKKKKGMVHLYEVVREGREVVFEDGFVRFEYKGIH